MPDSEEDHDGGVIELQDIFDDVNLDFEDV